MGHSPTPKPISLLSWPVLIPANLNTSAHHMTFVLALTLSVFPLSSFPTAELSAPFLSQGHSPSKECLLLTLPFPKVPRPSCPSSACPHLSSHCSFCQSQLPALPCTWETQLDLMPILLFSAFSPLPISSTGVSKSGPDSPLLWGCSVLVGCLAASFASAY